jgi:signal transduction histidine kinase
MIEGAAQTILIVDDTAANLNVLSTMLTQHGYKVRPAINGRLALASIARDQPDLILLDIKMPEMDGYEVCTLLKQDDLTRDIPIIFISALDEIEDKMRAFQVGGVDYVTKPFHAEEVLARVRAHITLQDQRRRISTQLAEIAKLSGFKDDLLRIVSHDLKNPISAIRGYAELLLEDPNAEDTPEYAERILRSANFMNSLVGDLLELSRAEGDFPLDMQTTSLDGVISACVTAYELAAHERQIALRYTPPSAPLLVRLDAMRFSQVMNNLISNGIKYTPPGGVVDVRAFHDDAWAVIEVADTGLGIPAEDMPRIFDKFFRVSTKEHQQVSGTGLGLAIAKALVEKHGGRIGVSSVVGEGSLFTIWLPA